MPANLLVVPLGKELSGIPLILASWTGGWQLLSELVIAL